MKFLRNVIDFLLFRKETRTIRGTVYMIKIGDTVYVGGTTQRLAKRLEQHVEQLEEFRHSNPNLQRAYQIEDKPVVTAILWQDDYTYHDILANKENFYMKRHANANLRDANADDYGHNLTMSYDKYLYPFLAWLVILSVFLGIISSWVI